MKNVILIILVLIGIGFQACVKKEKDMSVQVTYTGHIYRLDDSTPIANTSFAIHSFIAASAVSGRKSDEKTTPFTTDDNGYFSVKADVFDQGDVDLCWPDLSIITGIGPFKGSQDLGKIYAK